eukprot:GILK01017765.1.p1 GENE.GILK01017765.1~~GILK01017765.1.p1  ORF type:complete len:252 (+),score=19.22 GILK01017765.1:30-758(+)
MDVNKLQEELRAVCLELVSAVQTHPILMEEKIDEKIYQRLLVHKLRGIGYEVSTEREFKIWFDGIVVTTRRTDILVTLIDGTVVVLELKNVDKVTDEHRAQCKYYMKQLDLRTGFLINFRFKRSYQPLFPPGKKVVETKITCESEVVQDETSSAAVVVTDDKKTVVPKAKRSPKKSKTKSDCGVEIFRYDVVDEECTSAPCHDHPVTVTMTVDMLAAQLAVAWGLGSETNLAYYRQKHHRHV